MREENVLKMDKSEHTYSLSLSLTIADHLGLLHTSRLMQSSVRPEVTVPEILIDSIAVLSKKCTLVSKTLSNTMSKMSKMMGKKVNKS